MSSSQQLLLGEGAGGSAPVYIEDVFSTYLYTGNGATQTITNGIDLSTKGGLVWCKDRTAANGHDLSDTARGFSGNCGLTTDSTAAATGSDITGATSSGFTLGNISGNANYNGDKIVSWTFRKQPKFFDVVTYTGTGSAQNVAHSLGSVPGFIVYKRTSGAANWCVLARKSNGTYESFYLNTTGATQYTAADATEAGLTSTTFNPSAIFGGESNGTTGGGLYVAYLFAHDAGGFGLTGTDNVISCGSFTTDINGDFSPVTLGYEPQWLMFKRSSGTDNWVMLDIMRGIPTGLADAELKANLTNAETSVTRRVDVTSTGFKRDGTLDASSTYIYIAIRRGPMKVPTVGTTVFVPVLSSTTPTVLTSNFPVDMALSGTRTPGAYEKGINDRLRGFSDTSSGTSPWIVTNSNASESANTGTPSYYSAGNTSITIGDYFGGATLSNYLFGRAPSFMDVVCYTGTGSAMTVSHNLAAVPELIIAKRRTGAVANWPVYNKSLNGGVTPQNYYLFLSVADGENSSTTAWNDTAPTSSVFTIGTATNINASGSAYVAYLFATCAGVSKVGGYTGTGTTLQIDCGFTAGARWIMIKRTDSTGDWYVWDSARGIVAGNDPYLLLNTSAAEVTGTDYVDTYSAGFEISSTAPAAINASAGTFIFLAIA